MTWSGSSSATRAATSPSGPTSARWPTPSRTETWIRSRSVEALQDLLMAFRFAPKPVVSAPHGQTLGGGLEVCLHSDRIVAAGETYMGLVEVGVGLIPAGGGTKEMARRLISPPLHTPRIPHRCPSSRKPSNR